MKDLQQPGCTNSSEELPKKGNFQRAALPAAGLQRSRGVPATAGAWHANPAAEGSSPGCHQGWHRPAELPVLLAGWSLPHLALCSVFPLSFLLRWLFLFQRNSRELPGAAPLSLPCAPGSASLWFAVTRCFIFSVRVSLRQIPGVLNFPEPALPGRVQLGPV